MGLVPIIAAVSLWDQLGTCFSKMIAWAGEFVSALTTGDLVGLLPMLVIGIAISLILVCVKIVRKVTWGA